MVVSHHWTHGIEPVSFTRTTIALNHWVTSPVPSFLFWTCAHTCECACTCVCVHVRACVGTHGGGQRTTCRNSIFYCVGPRDEIQVANLGSKCLYQLNRLDDPIFSLLCFRYYPKGLMQLILGNDPVIRHNSHLTLQPRNLRCTVSN